jgi:large subunit ribosomal protein L32
MPVPKRKTSKARRDKRSAGKVTKKTSVVRCQTCDAPVLPHQVCKECGHYKGVKVVRTKTDRLYERNQVRQAKQRSQAPAQGSVAHNSEPTKQEK